MVDTGFWVALFDHSDHHHISASRYLPNMQEPLITTLPVMTETCHLLQKRSGTALAIAFARSHQRGAFSLFSIQNWHWPRIVELMEKYSKYYRSHAPAWECISGLSSVR